MLETGFKLLGICEGDSIKLNFLDDSDMHMIQYSYSNNITKNIYYSIEDNQKTIFPDTYQIVL